jgi:uncharacterized protein YjbI with pentapeptide repeats
MNPKDEPDQYCVPPEIYVLLAAAAADQKREIVVELIQRHPQGLKFSSHDRQGFEVDSRKLRLKPSPFNRGVDLESINLQGVNLDRIDLPAATLRKADLRGAELNRANLTGVDFAGALLQGAALGEANLRGAMLEDADLESANLRFANLRGSILEGANLAHADLWGSNLEAVALTNANLEAAVLNEANLEQADLVGACLKNATIEKANLRGAKLVGANLSGAHMKGADLRDAVLAEARLEQVDLLSCDLTHVYLADSWLERTRCSKEQFGNAIGEEVAGDFKGAEKGYLALERNFEGLGDSVAARWAYCKRRRMGKLFAYDMAIQSFKHRDGSNTLRWYARYAADQFVEWLCDYGESVPRVMASMMTVYVLFIVLYKLTHSVVRTYQTAGGLVQVPTGKLMDLAIFSLLAMTTSGSPAVGLQPSSEVVHLLTGTEALLGIGLTGLLGFVAGNRMRR